MESEIPKVLHRLNGKSLVEHVIYNLRSADIADIIVVVGYRGESVIEATGDTVQYVWQHEQLGTGHAVMQAEKALEGFNGSVVIACGDVPLIRPVTFKNMAEASREANTKAVVLTMIQENPAGYGRIIRDDQGNFQRIVEERDATDEEKKIKEVNTGTYIFNRDSLFKGLKSLGTNNAQGEYYLTDVLHGIVKSSYRVKGVVLENPVEGSGINSRADLKRLEEYLNNE